MHYNYFFNGCSWTYGTDLEHIERDRYSTLVSKDKTHINLAFGGSSNDSIALSTIQWFEEGNTCDTAIIQWTFCNRILYWQNENKKPINFLISRNIFPNKAVEEASKLYYKFYTNRMGAENYYKNIFLLKTYFELKKIDYRMICLTSYTKKEPYNWEFNNKLISIQNDWGVSIDIPSNLYIGNNLHPNEFGHQKIAQELKRIL